MRSLVLALVLTLTGIGDGCGAQSDDPGDSGELVIRPVIAEGAVAPGTNGATFSILSQPMIGPKGHVAFNGGLHAKEGLRGLWIASPDGEIRLVVRSGDEAPGCGGATFRELGLDLIDITSSGDVCFAGELYRKEHGISEHENEGIWYYSAGKTRLVVRRGHAAAPGEVRITWAYDLSPYPTPFTMNDAGTMAFMSYIPGERSRGNDRDQAIWFGTPGSFKSIARFGDPVPDIPNATFRRFFTRTVLTNNDHIAFFGSALPVPSGEPFGIWAGKPDDLKLIVRGGDPALGIPDGLFNQIGQPRLNSNGDLVFCGGASFVDANGMWKAIDGVWATADGEMRMIARGEQPAPGLDGALFRYFYQDRSPPKLNSNGDVVFLADLITGRNGVTRENDTTFWVERDKQLQLVAREGDQAPGTQGAVFDRFSDPTISRKGNVVFVAWLKKGIGDRTDESWGGLWRFHSRTQKLQLVVRVGDLFDVEGDGKVIQKYVSSISFTSGFTGTGGINERGAFTFKLTFTDETSGIFVAEPR